ncbi:MAG: hypothetical protein KAW92_02235 [Candidatus Cloacimonetes bacterium]|nr:hypothetical protein [Candidatus Cloacimonadota bacterium]
MKKNIKFKKYKLLLIILICLSCLVIFFETSEQKNSFLKSWLYEKNTTNELVVATVAMTPDKKPYITRDKIVGFIDNIKKNNQMLI